ncbi:heavy metal-associated domain-containing protein [Enterococcus asini]|uniref:heavy-metal-associated domain-containing protein n=1 Tax=Enterococcus asini TaxID=57732 RepID=UPI000E508F72|nr:heavy metal-associated domain-containing protein [Enterococcus asini]MCD5030081.1 heavy-metal-associated domain-containing protein [Enterococcus asini]MDT2745222.1 heavy metal-associated domain-containing protein [Enterococcus asini]MDT2764625.1 heavy metal-associated domain-containing protein [Enterococcus asini]MDT2785240.1 heavy metal-associated domain-containing protein [Enterococcus asini]RGW12463.1 heavy-metal-associated domain-containing protein [Enterococcus asini]
MAKAVLNLETLACPTCMQKIESGVKRMAGVDSDSVKVLFNASKLKATFNEKETSLAAIQKTVEDLGYPVLKAVEKASS